MPVANGDDEPVIVAFDVEYDSIRPDDAGGCVGLEHICRRFPLGPHRFVEPGVKGCFDRSVVLAAFETFDELSESLSSDDPHGRVRRGIGRLYNVPKMGTSREFTGKQQRVRGNGTASGRRLASRGNVTAEAVTYKERGARAEALFDSGGGDFRVGGPGDCLDFLD